jgi:ParB-like chromosome segregation protein Spo0J
MELNEAPIRKVRIEELIPNEYNPKRGLEDPVTREQYEYLKRTISKRFIYPIVVRHNEENRLEIVDGFHRYLALKELGVDSVPIIDLGTIPLDEAMAHTISLEKIKVPIDAIMEAGILKRMSENKTPEELSAELPYTKEYIENQIKLLEFDFDALKAQGAAAEDGGTVPVFRIEGDAQTIEECKAQWKRIMGQFEGMPEDTVLLEVLKKYV